MLRHLAALVLGGLALAPAAAADVRPLADRDDMGAPVLDGDRVVYADPGRDRLRVFERPLAGGVAIQLASVAEPPARFDAGRPVWDLAAGPDGLALRVHTGRRTRLLAGPPGGPQARVPGRSPGARDVETPDLFSVPGGPLVVDGSRVVLRPPDGPARELPMPRGADLAHLAVAGAILAVATRREIVVLDLSSGAVRRRLPLGRFAGMSLLGLSVSEAGDVAFAAEDGFDFIGWAPAGAAEPRLAFSGDEFGHVATAAGLIAAELPAMRGAAARVVVLDPSGDPTRVVFRGPPAAAIRGLDFDGRHVAWATDGCQLVADIGSPAIDVVPAGPCVRTEASFTQFVPSSVRYRIRCIASPGPRCRIDLRAYDPFLVARRVVTIPRGRARIVGMRVPVEHFITRARVIDPDGRRRIAITF